VADGASTVIISLGRKNELYVDPATLRYLAERDITVIVARRGMPRVCIASW
jgi:fructose-1-phosphate kinase PfkB-like protein